MVKTAVQRQYEQDFVAWCDETIAQLRRRHFDGLDIDGLIEELDGLAGRDHRS